MKAFLLSAGLLLILRTGVVAEDLEMELAAPETDLAYEEIARFTLALENIHRLHLSSGEKVSYARLVDAAISGMMGSLDGYSAYLAQDGVEELREMTTGEFAGVGVVITDGGEWITVVSPIAETPAWEAGLQAGDQVRAIDGESARGWSVRTGVERMRGPPGTEVSLRIHRPDENETFSVTLERAVIERPTVQDPQLLTGNVGYVRIDIFGERTGTELRRALTSLQRKGAEFLILDVRGNPGGLLPAAVDAAGLFLPLDALIVTMEGRDDTREEFHNRLGPHRWEPQRIAVLVDRGSASASEVLAGALQDHGAARVVGESTFGKASVQSIVPLQDGSALRLTTGNYFTPSGRGIHEQGIKPDEEVERTRGIGRLLRRLQADPDAWRDDVQLRRARELLLSEHQDTAEDEG